MDVTKSHKLTVLLLKEMQTISVENDQNYKPTSQSKTRQEFRKATCFYVILYVMYSMLLTLRTSEMTENTYRGCFLIATATE